MTARHSTSLRYEYAEDRFEELPASGAPLGIMAEMHWEAPLAFTLARGDLLVLFTDGFHETRRPDQELFGLQRVMDLIRTHREVSAAEIIAQLRDAVVRFSEGSAQQDDLTAIVVKRTA